MFCSNCGSKIADDAKFCSVCGARTASTGLESAAEHPVDNSNQYAANDSKATKKSDHGFSLDLDWDDGESHTRKRSSDVAFDWSSVVDDRNSRRRRTKNIRSPWEDYSDDFETVSSAAPISTSAYRTPEKEPSFEEELFGKEEPSRDRSRTMNFIDVLKQEKDEKERAEYEKLRRSAPAAQRTADTAYPAKQETVLPESQREHTQGYTDLKDDIIAEMDRREHSTKSFEEQLASIRAERQEARKNEVAPVKPQSFVEDSEAEFEKILNGMKSGFTEEPKKSEKDPLDDYFTGGEDLFAPEEKETEKESAESVFRNYEDSFTSVDEPSVEDEYADVQLNTAEEDDEPEETPVYTSEAEPNSIFFEDDEETPELNVMELDDQSEEEEPEDDVDLFADNLIPETNEEKNTEADVEDAYAGFDEYLDYIPKRRASRAARAAAEEEEIPESAAVAESEPEETVATPEVEAEPVKEAVSADASEPKEAVAAETVETVDDEIAALQKKLELLLKQKSGETNAEAEAEPAKAEEQPAAEEIPEVVSAEPIPEEPEVAPVKETPQEEPEASEAEEEPETTPEMAFADADDLDLEAELESLSGNAEPETAPEEDYSDIYVDGAEVPASDSTVEDVTPVLDIQDAVADNAAADTAFEENEQLDLDKELAQLGFDLGEDIAPEEPAEEDILFNTESIETSDKSSDTVVLPAEEIQKNAQPEAEDNSMSLEDLENDIFGGAPDADDLEATRKIDKFYTLYRKNEEFQKLLDAEYNKLQGGDIDDEMADSVNSILGEDTTEPETPATEAPTQNDLFAQLQQTPVQDAAPAQAANQEALVNATVATPQDDFAAAATEAAVKESKKKVRKKKKEKEEYDEKGGSALTVIAIVVAVLLVVLLGIILILNFAPESGIAQTLNEVIGNYTNFFADGGGSGSLM